MIELKGKKIKVNPKNTIPDIKITRLEIKDNCLIYIDYNDVVLVVPLHNINYIQVEEN